MIKNLKDKALNTWLMHREYIIGAVIGRFLNGCIYRLPKNLDIVSKISFCPRCKKRIKWFDNIPLISSLILKFKCRFCKKKSQSNTFRWSYYLLCF